MIPYVLLAVCFIYLISMVLNFKKVPHYKRKYVLFFEIVLVIGIVMGILGILFPAEASSKFAMITAFIAIIIVLGLVVYAVYKIKKTEREISKKK